MKKSMLIFYYCCCVGLNLYAQTNSASEKEIRTLIDTYSQARENRDTMLLKTILTPDIDQLVSTGEWRVGVRAAIRGMLNSSSSNPGTRTLTIDKLDFIDSQSALVDCRYDIQNPNGTRRSMWSAFILVSDGKQWKIRAIRNMMPAN